jgi:tetrachloro-p-hydroquinone reductive dehalogenase
MSDVVVYNIPPSLCSQKVRLVLVEMGVPFRNHWMDIGPTAENYEPWYVKLNPKCVVPTLVHGDEVVTDSAVIMRYVAETFEGPTLIRRHKAFWGCHTRRGRPLHRHTRLHRRR